MNKISTKKIALNGLMIALVFLGTYLTRIPGPVPPGYINFGDAIIMIAAILLGRNTGLVAGSIGSAIADIVSGGMIFAPFTFIIKGVEGFVIGLIVTNAGEDRKGEALKIIAVIIGSGIMVAGYFFAELTALQIFDKTFGYTAAITELPLNLIQGGISIIIGYALTSVLTRAGIKKALI